MAYADVDVAAYISAESTSFTLGTNLFEGPLREHSEVIPVNCAFVTPTGGEAALRQLKGSSTAATQPEIRRPTVQVRVRWDSYATCRAKAAEIHNILENGSITGYMDISARQSSPLYMGREANGYEHFSQNFTLMRQST